MLGEVRVIFITTMFVVVEQKSRALDTSRFVCLLAFDPSFVLIVCLRNVLCMA